MHAFPSDLRAGGGVFFKSCSFRFEMYPPQLCASLVSTPESAAGLRRRSFELADVSLGPLVQMWRLRDAEQIIQLALLDVRAGRCGFSALTRALPPFECCKVTSAEDAFALRSVIIGHFDIRFMDFARAFPSKCCGVCQTL